MSTANLVLPKTLQKYLEQIRLGYEFESTKFIDKKARLLNEYMRKAGLKGCVVSVSGGIDSAVTYMLARYASELANSPIEQVIGISQPIHSTHKVFIRTFELPGNIRIIDQTSIFDKLSVLVQDQIKIKSNKFADGQLKSYLRTPVNYYVAQILSANGCPSIVLGTGNMDEDQYLGYFCKAGDGVVDVQLISDIHKSQVYDVAKELKVPQSIINGQPTADLWEDQTDEDELGFPYDFIELYTELLKKPELIEKFMQDCSVEELDYYNVNKCKAISIHNQNKHKLNFPVNL